MPACFSAGVKLPHSLTPSAAALQLQPAINRGSNQWPSSSYLNRQPWWITDTHTCSLPYGAFLSLYLVLLTGRTDLLCTAPGAGGSWGARGSASHRSPAQPACGLGHFSSVGGNSPSAFGVHVAQGMKRGSGFLGGPLAEHKAIAVIPRLPTLRPRQLRLFTGVLPRNS